MSKILGVTVGTPLSPHTIKEKLKPVTSVNGVKPGADGNVEITIPSGGDVDLSGYAKMDDIPTKVSELDNDVGYLTEHQDISGKLDADKLPEAINLALAQAKDSGEFDGKDGRTPVKGTDYFTEADKQEIAEQAAQLVDVPEVDPVQADLAQTDPSKPDYVKNRTHGIGLAEIATPGIWTSYPSMGTVFAITSPVNLQAGKTYTVTWDGIQYKSVATEYIFLDVSIVVLGNFPLFDESGDTGEPFVIADFGEDVGDGTHAVVKAVDGSTEHTFSISEEVVHKLDPKFYERLAWVDDDAILPEWKCKIPADVSVIPGAPYVPLEVGAEYTVNLNGTTHKCVAQSINEYGDDVVGFLVEPLVVMTGTFNGIEQLRLWNTTLSPIDVTISIYRENVHQIDEKFIPNTIARVADVPDVSGYAKTEDIPTTLPNPHALTFTGAVNATYDGSEAVSVDIPSGGGGEWYDLMEYQTLTEDIAVLEFNNLKAKKFLIYGNWRLNDADNSNTTGQKRATVYINDKVGYVILQDLYLRQSDYFATQLRGEVDSGVFKGMHYQIGNTISGASNLSENVTTQIVSEINKIKVAFTIDGNYLLKAGSTLGVKVYV